MELTRLYLVDVGLLAAMVDLDAKTLLMGNSIFTEFKGTLTEQYICQQILSEQDKLLNLPLHAIAALWEVLG